MAEFLQPSTVAHLSRQGENKETLVRSLEDLLERFLHLLDRYQTLQQSLSQVLSRVRIDLVKFRLLILNPNRVFYHLLNPTFRIQIISATARSTTMVERRHQLVCMVPVFSLNRYAQCI